MIKLILGRIRDQWRNTIFAPLFVTLEALIECVIPLIMAKLIDDGINGDGGMASIWYYGGLLVGCALLSLLFGVLSGKFAADAAAGFARNLRHDMFYRLQAFSFRNIDSFSTAGLVTRLTTDVTNIQQAFAMLTRAIRGPAMLVISLIFCFRINITMTWIFLGAVPVLALGLFLITKYAHPVFTKVFKVYDKLNRVVQENLRGIRVVKSFVREEHEVQKFNEISDDIYKRFSLAERIVSFNGPLMQFTMYACMLLVCWFGAKIIVNTNEVSMTTGELASMFSYAGQILGSLMMLSMVFVMLTISRASGDRITEVLNTTSDIQNPSDPVTEVKDGSITFDHVRFSYAGDLSKLCLKDAHFTICSGETVGIIGGTGSSKSSLVQLIPRLYDVTEGSVSVGGVDVRQYDIEALRQNVAMVLQKNELFSGTIKDNLRWGNEHATQEEMEHVCRLAQADSFIQEMPDGYDTYIEQGGTNVSGGQKQRLCIARALLKKPKILILDDSTSAVDTHTDAMIRKAFREYIPETTKIIIAQRISSVEDADKIIVLDGGEINGMGTHKELLRNNAIYREVYESQMKGAGDDAQ